MIQTLENSFLQFSIDLDQAAWSVLGKQPFQLAVQSARSGINLRLPGRWPARTIHLGLADWEERRISQPTPLATPHGSAQQVVLHGANSQAGLEFQAQFALPEGTPLFLWRLVVHNRSRQPVWVRRLDLLRAGSPAFPPGRKPDGSRLAGFSADLSFYSNGWQSWTFSGAYGPQERFRRTRLGPLTMPMRVNAGTPQPARAGHFASDFFGALADRKLRQGLLAGFLSQLAHFGSLEAWIAGGTPALRLWADGDSARLDPRQTVASDWACLGFFNLDDPDPLGIYLQAVARQNGLEDDQAASLPACQESQSLAAEERIPSGWCSWYQFYDRLQAADVSANTQAAARLQLPIQLIQIDDGYETAFGDWDSCKPSFPQGVAPLAQEIRAAGFTPGLWLAPFLVSLRSRLAAEHPDWLLRGRFNRPVNAGYIPGDGLLTALDLTHPAALAFAQESVHHAAHDWGFPYLKLDFLYAAALPGRYLDPTRTRAQVLRMGLKALRQAAGDETILLGCGCPLGPAIGLLNPLRIGADVGETWQPVYRGISTFFESEPDYPAARNAIQNTLTRAALHRRWWVNDPDVLLLRPEIDLSLEEIHTLATVIALSGGSLLLSDHLPDLPAERLAIARSLLPLIGKRPRLLDLFDSLTPSRLRLDLENASGPWHLLALFNWEDQPGDLQLRLREFGLDPHQPYFARDFWRGDNALIADGVLDLPGVPAHGVRLLALRPHLAQKALYIGGSLHISQGLEIGAWEAQAHALELVLERPGLSAGEIELHLPQPPQHAWLNGTPLNWQVCGAECYRFALQFERSAALQVRFAGS